MKYSNIFIPLISGAIVFIILYLIRNLSFRLLTKWAAKTKTKIDDIIISSFKAPSLYWCLVIGLYIGINVSLMPAPYVHFISKAIYVIVILSITIAISNLSGKIFSHYVKELKLPIPATGLAYGLIKAIIILIGILIMLNSLGISIAPLITALGIGGLAVALALQDTLANLFAGIHILVESSIRVGDFIKLETGEQGFVEDISWRTTRIRLLPNNIVIIPNSKLSQSIITNYYLPEKRMALLIPISVSYNSDPEKIEKILIEEAKKGVGEIAGLRAEPEPMVRFIPGFGESSLDFTLICHVNEFTDQFLVQHELRKRIFNRFKQEGIEIPYPHRVIQLQKE